MNLSKMWAIGMAEQFFPGKEYPKGACTCGLMMAGIPGGCQPHVHTNGVGKNKRVDLKEGDWVIPETDPVDLVHYYTCPPEVFEALRQVIDSFQSDESIFTRGQVRELYRQLKMMDDQYNKEKADYISKFMREKLWTANN